MTLTPIEQHIALSRSSDPETSHLAAAKQRMTLLERQNIVHQVMMARGYPMTHDQIIRAMRAAGHLWKDSGIRTRVSELVAQNRVEAAGKIKILDTTFMRWRAK